jgi:hypothetical protein
MGMGGGWNWPTISGGSLILPGCTDVFFVIGIC